MEKLKENYSTFISDLAFTIEQGRKATVQQVNTNITATYWLMGRRIVGYEQKGEERADCGEALLKSISTDLTPKFGKGFTGRNLGHMRQLYPAYLEISHKFKRL